jgi:hypothetical protein
LLLLLSNRAEKYASPMQAKVEVRPVSVSGLTYSTCSHACPIFRRKPRIQGLRQTCFNLTVFCFCNLG